jgi:hypothetical protein
MILFYVSVAVLSTSNTLILSRSNIYAGRGEESLLSYGNSRATSRSFDLVVLSAKPYFSGVNRHRSVLAWVSHLK